MNLYQRCHIMGKSDMPCPKVESTQKVLFQVPMIETMCVEGWDNKVIEPKINNDIIISQKKFNIYIVYFFGQNQHDILKIYASLLQTRPINKFESHLILTIIGTFLHQCYWMCIGSTRCMGIVQLPFFVGHLLFEWCMAMLVLENEHPKSM